MTSRMHAQEGIPTKYLQHPQNTQAVVSCGSKLAVLALFTPENGTSSQPHHYYHLSIGMHILHGV